ncbi:hypothetical protein MIR68_011390 [Amoeboaphelidium protococcarum]|nr:hypothetical protein MIR68_011390 [Amoeboaphelidium protococcarum]
MRPRNALKVDDEEETNEYEQRINASGCAAQNEQLQECYLKYKDWRKCKEEMMRFKECFEMNKKSRRQQKSNDA